MFKTFGADLRTPGLSRRINAYMKALEIRVVLARCCASERISSLSQMFQARNFPRVQLVRDFFRTQQLSLL